MRLDRISYGYFFEKFPKPFRDTFRDAGNVSAATEITYADNLKNAARVGSVQMISYG